MKNFCIHLIFLLLILASCNSTKKAGTSTREERKTEREAKAKEKELAEKAPPTQPVKQAPATDPSNKTAPRPLENK